MGSRLNVSKGLTITESQVEGGVYARGPTSWASDLIAGTEMSLLRPRMRARTLSWVLDRLIEGPRSCLEAGGSFGWGA